LFTESASEKNTIQAKYVKENDQKFIKTKIWFNIFLDKQYFFLLLLNT